MRHAVILGMLLAMTAFADAAGGRGARPAGGGSSLGEGAGVSAQLRQLRGTSAIWELELTVRNGGGRAVYLMTDPVRTDNSKGPYMSVAPRDPSVLDLSVRVYSRPEY